MTVAGRLSAITVATVLSCCATETPPTAAAPPAAAPCVRATADKLGIPFVKICPEDQPAGVVLQPFWIAAAPLDCSAGSHETVLCPLVVPVARPAERETGVASTLRARSAAILDASTAHRLCSLRFGGRLPTAMERSQAEDALGLQSAIVHTQSSPARFEVRPFAEWVTAEPCLSPSGITPACGIDQFPAGASSVVDWPRLRACDARPAATADVAPRIGVGDDCPSEPDAVSSGDAVPVPCLLGAHTAGGLSQRDAFALSCRPLTEVEARHPDQTPPDVAAFRCVLPASALTPRAAP